VSEPPGCAALRDQYAQVRARTLELAAPLSPEDCAAQSMPDASPVKWHLAHTTWFFEVFVLEAGSESYRVFNPAFRVLFNSYYNAVGDQYQRSQRGLLTRPDLATVRAYREHVDAAVDGLLARGALSAREAGVLEIGLHHEQQHQELILTDVKHLLSCNPTHPAYRELPAPPRQRAAALRWHREAGGVCWVGAGERGYAFDNERPRHRVFLEPFELASRPVTNREYLEFMRDGGYTCAQLWLSEGWSAARARGWRAPLYWEPHHDGWRVMTLAGLRELDLDAPVCHVSYFEADAFARWAGARLPGETEWELVACQAPVKGNFAESGLLQPAAALELSGAPGQLFGDVWEWTRSAYAPYPGFRPLQGALGEYNGKFMCGQQVLRGGSCATPGSHVRASYRNFFYPPDRWQFSGIRLARDA
jgi:ergothioneine biosynthesis protein EgtB